MTERLAVLCSCDFCRKHVGTPIVPSAKSRELLLRAYGSRPLPRLREVRESCGFTRSELEHESGISRHSILSLERGEFQARRATANKLAAALMVPVKELEE